MGINTLSKEEYQIKAMKINVPIKINYKTILLMNLIYLLVLIYFSGNSISIGFKDKTIMLINKFDFTFYEGQDIFYGKRFIRLMFKFISFIPISIFAYLQCKYRNIGRDRLFFHYIIFVLVNIITLILLQFTLVNNIIISAYNYIVYIISYVLGLLIMSRLYPKIISKTLE